MNISVHWRLVGVDFVIFILVSKICFIVITHSVKYEITKTDKWLIQWLPWRQGKFTALTVSTYPLSFANQLHYSYRSRCSCTLSINILSNHQLNLILIGRMLPKINIQIVAINRLRENFRTTKNIIVTRNRYICLPHAN